MGEMKIRPSPRDFELRHQVYNKFREWKVPMLEIRYYDHLTDVLGLPKGKKINMTVDNIKACRMMLTLYGYSHYKEMLGRRKT